MAKDIFWLASYPKSGNTWIRFLLIAYKFGTLHINDNIGLIISDNEPYQYNAVSPVDLTKMPAEGTLYLRYTVILHMLASNRYNPLIIKTHNVRERVRGVPMFPEALFSKAVYILRDPRDLVPSYARHMGLSIDKAIDHISSNKAILHDEKQGVCSWLSTWSQHVRTWNGEDVTVIRYEDLKTDTAEMFTHILTTFGIEVDKVKLRKAITLCSLGRLKGQEAKDGFIERKNQDKFFGDGKGWQNELSESQVRRIEQEHGEVMQKMGYKLEYL
jgi:hypothetical protein